MKHLLILTVGICLLASVPALEGQGVDEAAVREATEKLIAAWNAHDSTAVIAWVHENHENWVGTIKGRAARDKQNEELLAGPWKNLKIELLDEIGIVFVTPDVAIYKGRYSNSGIVDRAGKAMPPYKLLWAGIWMKEDGKWLLATTFSRRIEE